jgi:hypothetical protein
MQMISMGDIPVGPNTFEPLLEISPALMGMLQ